MPVGEGQLTALNGLEKSSIRWAKPAGPLALHAHVCAMPLGA